jgi:tripartite-type tricarboxylate transporter receptor subunit TctC
MARLVGQFLSERLGQQFIIENRPGAGGNIGVEAVANAAPDGYTVLLIGANNAINASLYKKLPFNFIRDIAPVAAISIGPNVMTVNPTVPANNVAEFIAYAKANEGKISFASAGNGTTIHLSGELFMAMTGVKMLHVPYRGAAPALSDLISGQVHTMFDNLPSSMAHIQSGTLRALAVTTATRSPALPDVPSIAETVPGYDTSVWFGMGAPKGTPREVIEKMNAAIKAAVADPKLKARLAELGTTPMTLSPEELAAFIAAETEKWAKVVAFAGVKMD